MIEAIYKVIFTISGLLLIVFNRRWAEHVVRYWNGVRPNMYGDSALALFRLAAVFGGCWFIAYGVSDLW